LFFDNSKCFNIFSAMKSSECFNIFYHEVIKMFWYFLSWSHSNVLILILQDTNKKDNKTDTKNIKTFWWLCGRKYITFMYGNNLKDLYAVKESRRISNYFNIKLSNWIKYLR
jgi:hypothetical protein